MKMQHPKALDRKKENAISNQFHLTLLNFSANLIDLLQTAQFWQRFVLFLFLICSYP